MSRESQTIEWKESWRDDYLRWVCGFANSKGGVLVIGRNDQGEAVGIANGAKLLEDLPNKIRDLLGIIVEVNRLVEGGAELLEIHVPAYSNPISYRGRYYLRSGSTLQESPLPVIRLDGHDLWVEFPYSQDYLALLERETAANEQRKGSVNGLVESQQKILRMVKNDPHISKKTMAETIGISTTAIDKNIEKLKAQGFLKRVGSPKSGHWEVIK